MTPEDQRMAIAKACGWTRFTPDTIQFTARRSDGKWDLIPDYLNDLNAMHEAVAKLGGAELERFAENLQEVVGLYCVGVVPDYHRHLRNLAKLVNVTAAQLAEAFLKTLNLWTHS